MTEQIDPFVTQIRELCTQCARAVVQISNNNNYPPTFVADLFIDTFQHIIDQTKQVE